MKAKLMALAPIEGRPRLQAGDVFETDHVDYHRLLSDKYTSQYIKFISCEHCEELAKNPPPKPPEPVDVSLLICVCAYGDCPLHPIVEAVEVIPEEVVIEEVVAEEAVPPPQAHKRKTPTKK